MNSPRSVSKKVRMMAQHLVREAPGGTDFAKHYSEYLPLVQMTHPEFISALEAQMEEPGETLGLSGSDLIELMKRLNNPRTVRKLVFNKLSPDDQKAHPELAEELDEVAVAPGTSFTSTANTAPYAVPLGSMMRREWWTKKKKRKEK